MIWQWRGKFSLSCIYFYKSGGGFLGRNKWRLSCNRVSSCPLGSSSEARKRRSLKRFSRPHSKLQHLLRSSAAFHLADVGFHRLVSFWKSQSLQGQQLPDMFFSLKRIKSSFKRGDRLDISERPNVTELEIAWIFFSKAVRAVAASLAYYLHNII